MLEGLARLLLKVNQGMVVEVLEFNPHRMEVNHLRITQEVVRTVKDRLRKKKKEVVGVHQNLFSMGQLVILQFISRTL